MSYNYIDLLTTSLNNSFKVISGERYLNNPIRWPHVAELSETFEQLEQDVLSGDLLIVTGALLKSNVSSSLNQLFSIAINKNISGLLLFANKHLKSIPDELLSLADANKIPVILLTDNNPNISDFVCSIVYSLNTPDGNHSRKNNILKDLLSDNYDNPLSLISRAQFYHINLDSPYYAICIQYTDGTNNDEQLRALVEKNCNGILKQYYSNYLHIFSNNMYICLLPSDNSNTNTITICNKIVEQLSSFNINTNIGIGNTYDNINGFKQSINESKEIISLMSVLNLHNKVKNSTDLFIFHNISKHISSPIMKAIQDTCLSTLIHSDSEEQGNLIHTLDCYFENNKNISITAEKLFIHRNTLKNRLTKIEQLTNSSLSDPIDCFSLQLALYVHKIYNNWDFSKPI